VLLLLQRYGRIHKYLYYISEGFFMKVVSADSLEGINEVLGHLENRNLMEDYYFYYNCRRDELCCSKENERFNAAWSGLGRLKKKEQVTGRLFDRLNLYSCISNQSLFSDMISKRRRVIVEINERFNMLREANRGALSDNCYNGLGELSEIVKERLELSREKGDRPDIQSIERNFIVLRKLHGFNIEDSALLESIMARCNFALNPFIRDIGEKSTFSGRDLLKVERIFIKAWGVLSDGEEMDLFSGDKMDSDLSSGKTDVPGSLRIRRDGASLSIGLIPDKERLDKTGGFFTTKTVRKHLEKETSDEVFCGIENHREMMGRGAVKLTALPVVFKKSGASDLIEERYDGDLKSASEGGFLRRINHPERKTVKDKATVFL
jgi:hypothetical protein